MTRHPDFVDLVGEDLPDDERERLRRVHELLVAAGPPPEVPPVGVEPPRDATVHVLPRRRRGALLILAAALAVASFAGGYVVADRDEQFAAERTIVMRGVGEYEGARAALFVGAPDAAGNHPMLVRVTGLPAVQEGGYYEVMLVRGDEQLSCGSFLVAPGTTQRELTAPYRLRASDEWIIAAHPKGHLDDPPVAMEQV